MVIIVSFELSYLQNLNQKNPSSDNDKYKCHHLQNLSHGMNIMVILKLQLVGIIDQLQAQRKMALLKELVATYAGNSDSEN